MVKEDYIMRIIHEAVRLLMKLIFGIDEVKQEEIELESQEAEEKYQRLKLLAKEGRINEAENLLSDWLDGQNLEYFQMALLFYDYINSFEEERLEKAGFSREEITEGILFAARMYGHDGMVGALLEQ